MPVNCCCPGHPWKVLTSKTQSGAKSSSGICCASPNSESTRCTTSTFDIVLLALPGGFEGFVSIGEPFDPQHLPVAERAHRPIAKRDRCTACLALHLTPHMREDLVVPRLKEFVVLKGALTPGPDVLDVEVPHGFATPDRVGLGQSRGGTCSDSGSFSASQAALSRRLKASKLSCATSTFSC